MTKLPRRLVSAMAPPPMTETTAASAGLSVKASRTSPIRRQVLTDPERRLRSTSCNVPGR